MKFLKSVFFALIGIVVIVLIIAIFLKKEYGVEKDVVINKSKSEVFDYIRFLKNQDNYSVWAKTDPNMKKGFSGTDGTVGATSSWESLDKNVGEGEQEIVKIIEGERIDYVLRFFEPFESTDYAYIITESIGENQTNVKWGFNGKMNYPMNLMLLFMNMEEMLGKDLEDGLNNLKEIMEKE